MSRGVAILIEVETDDVEFVVAGHVGWQRRLGRGRGRLYIRESLRLIAQDFATVFVSGNQSHIFVARSRW
jgi:hypothetical protein